MQKVEHEAGYDSMMTAQIFIKLTSLLHHGHTLKYSGSVPLAPQANQLPAYIRPDVPSNAGQRMSKELTSYLHLEDNENFITSIPSLVSAHISEMVDRGELIPRLGAEFWETYGNTLRVFGTQERICSFG